MKKIVPILMSILLVTSIGTFSACSNNQKSEDAQTKPNVNSSISQEIESKVESKTSKPLESSLIPKEDSSQTSSEESKEESSEIESSETTSETSKEEPSKPEITIDTQKYVRPNVSKQEIIIDVPVSFLDTSDSIINGDTFEYMVEHFNNKVYKMDQIINVKDEMKSMNISKDYYELCAEIYNSLNHFTINTPFEEVSVTLDKYMIHYVLDDNTDLILKSTEDMKFNIYLKDTTIYFMLSKL